MTDTTNLPSTGDGVDPINEIADLLSGNFGSEDESPSDAAENAADQDDTPAESDETDQETDDGPSTEDEIELIISQPDTQWIRDSIEDKSIDFAVTKLVPEHLDVVKTQRETRVDKTIEAIKSRLTTEINYWDHRAQQLKEQELAGKTNARMNSAKARMRADELTSRLRKRLGELAQERRVSPLPPNVIGGAMIVPIGLLRKLQGQSTPTTFAHNTSEVERIGMRVVMDVERSLGYEPRDVSMDKCGYDIESRIPNEPGKLRFIEVKSRVKGADTVTITKNEILTGLNKPDQFILAIVEVDGNATEHYYIRNPFNKEPDFGVTSVNYKLKELKEKAMKYT